MLQHPTSHRPQFSACVAFLLIALLAVFASSRTHAASAATPNAPTSHSVLHLSIDSEIEPILADYISNGIDRANADHDSLVIITINTPAASTPPCAKSSRKSSSRTFPWSLTSRPLVPAPPPPASSFSSPLTLPPCLPAPIPAPPRPS